MHGIGVSIYRFYRSKPKCDEYVRTAAAASESSQQNFGEEYLAKSLWRKWREIDLAKPQQVAKMAGNENNGGKQKIWRET